jgi:hypothetical protein
MFFGSLRLRLWQKSSPDHLSTCQQHCCCSLLSYFDSSNLLPMRVLATAAEKEADDQDHRRRWTFPSNPTTAWNLVLGASADLAWDWTGIPARKSERARRRARKDAGRTLDCWKSMCCCRMKRIERRSRWLKRKRRSVVVLSVP